MQNHVPTYRGVQGLVRRCQVIRLFWNSKTFGRVPDGSELKLGACSIKFQEGPRVCWLSGPTSVCRYAWSAVAQVCLSYWSLLDCVQLNSSPGSTDGLRSHETTPASLKSHLLWALKSKRCLRGKIITTHIATGNNAPYKSRPAGAFLLRRDTRVNC